MRVRLSTRDILRGIKEYALISLGLLMYAFTWICIITPADFVGGGMAGLSQLIYYATGGATGGGVPIAVTFFISNALLLIVASFIIGWKFGAKTIYAIFFISFSMGALQQWIPADLLGLAQDKLLSAILGGAVAGIGISICFTQGGSTGGTDVVAMIINKYRNVSYGKVLIMCDFIIIGSSLFIFMNIPAIIYGYVLVAVFGYTIDAVLAGNRQSSQIMIVSRNHEQIAERISTEVVRGVTILEGYGWYTKEPRKVVMVVCRKNETSTMFRIIKECDAEAFITVGSVMGVYGLGFEALKK